NILTGANYFAGLEVTRGSTLVIGGTGTLTSKGGSNSAGIGASGNDGNTYTSTLGTIIINSGTINANGGRNGAGIGDARVGEGGTVIINGGNIFARSDGNGTGIGGGGSDTITAANYTGMFVTVNGGIISVGGSIADIGWGKDMNTNSKLAIYGGSIHHVNSKGKGAGEEPTKDTHINVSLDVKSIPSIDAVYVDGMDQHITGFHSRVLGTQSNTIALQLYMTKDQAHTIEIVSGSTTYTYSVINNTAALLS
ncbi:MAG: hypothetical protein LBR68_05810, partial [Lachnoclostridium sp.]|nr:hypothetical protein [Lachnoclostridium sp.]